MQARRTKTRSRAAQAEGGFTLVEVLMVLAIIGIIAAIAIPELLGARTKAQQAKCSELSPKLDAEIVLEAQRWKESGIPSSVDGIPLPTNTPPEIVAALVVANRHVGVRNPILTPDEPRCEDSGNFLVDNPNCAYVVHSEFAATARCQTNFWPIVDTTDPDNPLGLGAFLVVHKDFEGEIHFRALMMDS